MLQITDSAARTLKHALLNVTEVEDPRFRVGIVEGSVKMAIDQERAGDTIVVHEGEALIVMDTATSDRLHGRQLDLDDETSGLVLK
jgi:Fe-S cluster assembly iron-binding protein IscA